MKKGFLLAPLALAACTSGNNSDTQLPNGEWARFNSPINGAVTTGKLTPATGNPVPICRLDKITIQNNIITKTLHEVAPHCDCNTAIQEDAAICLGEEIINPEPDDCPALQGASGIPFIPPGCLGRPPFYSDLATQTDTSQLLGELPVSVLHQAIASDGSPIFLAGINHLNLEGTLNAQCDANTVIAMHFNSSNQLIVETDDTESSPQTLLGLSSFLPYHRVSANNLQQSCTQFIPASGNSMNTNNTTLDNALSPFQGLDVEVAFTVPPISALSIQLHHQYPFYPVTSNSN